MTSTEIRAALTEVGQAVDVPAVDDVAFRARVRAERRRRATARVLLAGTAAAAVVTGVVVTTTLLDSLTDGNREDAPAANLPAPSAPGPVPVSVSSRLVIVQPDGALTTTRVRTEDVVGTTDLGVVVVDHESRVKLVPLDAQGRPGTPRELVGDQPVQAVRVDKGGNSIAFLDLANRVHIRDVGAAVDRVDAAVPASSTLVAVDRDSWIEEQPGKLVLGDPDSSRTFGTGPDTFGAEMAGETIAVATADGFFLLDSGDLAPRHDPFTGGVGSLSPSGEWYAAAAGEAERDRGEAGTLRLVDAATGDSEELQGYDAQQQALDISWQDEDRFSVVTSSHPKRVLWTCSAAELLCEASFEDPTGTLGLPTS